MRYISIVLVLSFFSSCSKNIDCNTLESCFEHNGMVMMITEINDLSNINGDTSIFFSSIDTNSLNLKMECGKFFLGAGESIEEGRYEIINDEIRFILSSDPCPINAECLTAFHQNKYKWSCTTDLIKLTLFEEWISLHAEDWPYGSYASKQISRQIIY